MQPCPTCKAPISKHALACPHCGEDFTRHARLETNRRLLFLAGCLLSFPAVWLTLLAIFNHGPNPGWSDEANAQAQRTGWGLLAAFYLLAFLGWRPLFKTFMRKP